MNRHVTMNHRAYHHGRSGFVALTAVILLSAVLLYVVTSLSLQIIDEAAISSGQEQSMQAESLANACAEYALLQLSNDPAYDMDETLNDFPVADHTCEIQFVETGLTYPKTIQITSVVGDHNYTAEVEIIVSTTTPSVTIESWNDHAEL